jgi:hypothetical protein
VYCPRLERVDYSETKQESGYDGKEHEQDISNWTTTTLVGFSLVLETSEVVWSSVRDQSSFKMFWSQDSFRENRIDGVGVMVDELIDSKTEVGTMMM